MADKYECEWCDSQNVVLRNESAYWELPDGTRAIEITDVLTVHCQDCLIYYQPENVVKEIEDQLFLVDTKKIGKTISYQELIDMPRLLKRNYFEI